MHLIDKLLAVIRIICAACCKEQNINPHIAYIICHSTVVSIVKSLFYKLNFTFSTTDVILFSKRLSYLINKMLLVMQFMNINHFFLPKWQRSLLKRCEWNIVTKAKTSTHRTISCEILYFNTRSKFRCKFRQVSIIVVNQVNAASTFREFSIG